MTEVTTEMMLEKQISNLMAVKQKLEEDLNRIQKEGDYNCRWRDAVTNALTDDMGVDIDIETAVEQIIATKTQCKSYEAGMEETVADLEFSANHLRNLYNEKTEEEKESENMTQDLDTCREQLLYGEDWRNAVTNALLDGEGYKISHQRAIEIIKDLKNQKGKTQEPDSSVQITPYFRKVTYDDVIEFLKKHQDQQAEIDRLNKQLQEYENKLYDLLEVLGTANDHLNKITTRRSQTTSSQNKD